MGLAAAAFAGFVPLSALSRRLTAGAEPGQSRSNNIPTGDAEISYDFRRLVALSAAGGSDGRRRSLSWQERLEVAQRPGGDVITLRAASRTSSRP